MAAFEEESSGDESDAVGHLQKSVELNPSFSKGEAMLGDIYSRRGDKGLARQYHLAALKAYPSNYEAQDRLGELLVNEGRYTEAIPHLEAAVRNPQADAKVDYLLGASLVEEKRPVEAIPYLQRAPDKKEAITFLGLALQSEGDVKDAANDYRRALEIDPQYAPAREELAEAERLMTTHQGQ